MSSLLIICLLSLSAVDGFAAQEDTIDLLRLYDFESGALPPSLCHWKWFDMNPTWSANSPSGEYGTLLGSALDDQALPSSHFCCLNGNAFGFSDGQLNVPLGSVLSESDPFTIVLWLSDEDAWDSFGFSAVDSGVDAFGFEMSVQSGACLFSSSSSEVDLYPISDSSDGFLSQEGTHLAFVHEPAEDGGSLTLFRNGRAVGCIQHLPYEFDITEMVFSSDCFDPPGEVGLLSECVVYDHALSVSQVYASYLNRDEWAPSRVKIPYESDFEQDEGWFPGFLDAHDEWLSAGLVRVVDSDAASGSQSIEILPSSGLHSGVKTDFDFSKHLDQPVYVDMMIRPWAVESDDAFTQGFLYSVIRLAYVKEGVSGRMAVWDDSRKQWVSFGPLYGLDHGLSASWIRLTVRFDNLVNRGEICMDGSWVGEVALPEGWKMDFDSLKIMGTSAGPFRVDYFYVGSEDPLGDLAWRPVSYSGLPMESGFSQASATASGFAISNTGPVDGLVDYSAAIDSSTAPYSWAELYVDNVTGDDLSDGICPVENAGSGPLASIERALAVATDSTVLFLAGTNLPYYLESMSVSGRNIVISPVGDVVMGRDGTNSDE